MLEYFVRLAPQLLEGAQITLAIFGVTIVFALPLGFLVSLARISTFDIG